MQLQGSRVQTRNLYPVGEWRRGGGGPPAFQRSRLMYRPALRRRCFHQIVVGRKAFAVDEKPALVRAHDDMRAIRDIAAKKKLRQWVLQAPLDHALQRSRAIDGIISGMRQPFARLGIEIDRDLAIGQKLRQTPDLDVDDLVHVLTRQAMEQNDLVEPVQEFRAEMVAYRFHDLRAGLCVVARLTCRKKLRTEIRRENDHRVL